MNATEVRRLALVRGLVGIACFFLCLITFVFEIVYICYVSRKRRQAERGSVRKTNSTTTLQRLFVYLTFSNILYTAALSLHIENVFEDGNFGVHCYVCKAVGFFDQYSGSVQLLLTIGIIVKLFHKLRSFCPRKTIHKGVLSRHHFKFEALFVTLCFLVPLLVIWVPFLMHGKAGGEYGSDGAWCWIQVLKNGCGDSNKGLWEQLLLWYIPYAAVTMLSLICIAAIIGTLIFICVRHRNFWRHIRVVLLDMMLLLPFLVVFCCVCFIEISIVIFFKLEQSNIVYNLNTYVMWMFYAIITPVSGAVIPIAFFIYHLRKKHFTLSQKLHNISNAQPHTIRPSNRLTVNSDSDKGRPNFKSGSDVQWSTPSGSAVVVDACLVENLRGQNYGAID